MQLLQLQLLSSYHEDISIVISAIFMQLWVLHVIFTYVNNTFRMFPLSLLQLIMSRGMVQTQPSPTSVDHILCNVKNQILMLLSSTTKCFLYPERVIQVQVD